MWLCIPRKTLQHKVKISFDLAPFHTVSRSRKNYYYQFDLYPPRPFFYQFTNIHTHPSICICVFLKNQGKKTMNLVKVWSTVLTNVFYKTRKSFKDFLAQLPHLTNTTLKSSRTPLFPRSRPLIGATFWYVGLQMSRQMCKYLSPRPEYDF